MKILTTNITLKRSSDQELATTQNTLTFFIENKKVKPLCVVSITGVTEVITIIT